jgi:heme/copper-type cytochrome/quinol oxidase subunit 2
LADGNHTVYLEVSDNSTNQNKANVTWTFTIDTSEDEPPSPPSGDFLSEYWWIILVIVIVIVLILLLFLFMKKRRKAEVVSEPGEGEVSSESKPENP